MIEASVERLTRDLAAVLEDAQHAMTTALTTTVIDNLSTPGRMVMSVSSTMLAQHELMMTQKHMQLVQRANLCDGACQAGCPRSHTYLEVMQHNPLFKLLKCDQTHPDGDQSQAQEWTCPGAHVDVTFDVARFLTSKRTPCLDGWDCKDGRCRRSHSLEELLWFDPLFKTRECHSGPLCTVMTCRFYHSESDRRRLTQQDDYVGKQDPLPEPEVKVGEHVTFVEEAAPKGPRAALVRRTEVASKRDTNPNAASVEKKKKKKEKKKTPKPKIVAKTPPSPPEKPRQDQGQDVMAALACAMRMLMGSPRAGSQSAVAPPQPERARSTIEPLQPHQYHDIIQLVTKDTMHVPTAIEVLRRTNPIAAARLESLDRDTQQQLLIPALQNELDSAQLREIQARATDGLDFGYSPLPSPVAADPQPEPAPTTIRCEICLDDDPIEDVFIVEQCGHAYCRDSMRNYILGRIDNQDLTPQCPNDGCETRLTDAEMTQVLTEQEQLDYYNTCMSLAVGTVPGLFQCMQEDCHGVASLPPDDPRFVCPICRAERCVACNTRTWHDGLDCEQHRQRERDSVLHPEQLQRIYGSRRAFQCGSTKEWM
ncbi:hypothetical protein ATCC90586_004930 [Pythium insidiosum]|nr:hypothetical protein ATCC90586_004930 [Pythium insidiosum]